MDRILKNLHSIFKHMTPAFLWGVLLILFILDANLPYLAQFFLFFVVIILFIPSVIFTGTVAVLAYGLYLTTTLLGRTLASSLAVYSVYSMLFTFMLYVLDKDFSHDLLVAIQNTPVYKRVISKGYYSIKIFFLGIGIILFVADIIKSIMLRDLQLSLLQSIGIIVLSMILLRTDK